MIREAERLDFRTFVLAYEELVRKVHAGKVSPDDFAGVTVTLTNPGTLGTVQSVPRLMPGPGGDRRRRQHRHAGRAAGGRSACPRSHRGRPGRHDHLHLRPPDHPGRRVRECSSRTFPASLQGEHRFYDEVFASMDVPFEPVRWMPDRNATDDELDRLEKQVHVQSLINMYRVRGHLIADLDPLAAEPAHLHPELDPATYGLTLWDLDREFVVAGLAGKRAMTLGTPIEVLARRLLQHPRDRVHAHAGS